MPRRVLVTGLGVVSALGAGTDLFWSGLIRGASGFARTGSDLSAAGVSVAGVVADLSVEHHLRDQRHLRTLNRTFALAVVSGALAASDGALDARPIAPPRLGIVVAIGSIDPYTDDIVAAARAAVTSGSVNPAVFADTARSVHPFRRLRLLPNVAAAILSIEHRALGASVTLVSGTATAGIQALTLAAAMIRQGAADAVLCGGVDSSLAPLSLRQFALEHQLSPSQNPDLACRPFDRDRDGIVVGEGAAMLLLEAEESASARGRTAYSEILASGSSHRGDGGYAGMHQLTTTAGIDSPDVVIAHGDGGRESDAVEAAALTRFSARHVTSIQPAVGHTMSAAGAMSAAAGSLVLARGQVPPIRSLKAAEFFLPLTTDPVRGAFRSVMVNALDPDGASGSLLLGRV